MPANTIIITQFSLQVSPTTLRPPHGFDLIFTAAALICYAVLSLLSVDYTLRNNALLLLSVLTTQQCGVAFIFTHYTTMCCYSCLLALHDNVLLLSLFNSTLTCGAAIIVIFYVLGLSRPTYILASKKKNVSGSALRPTFFRLIY